MNLKDSSQEISKILNEGGIGIIPTDTMYGIVASALNEKAINKVFEIRKRNPKKPFIVLISSFDDLKIFGIELTEEEREILLQIWPNPVSVEMEVSDPKFKYLTRGTGRFAIRMPRNEEVRGLLEKSGPLIAPSVNLEGEKPAETLDEAWEMFPELDFYVDGGTLPNKPSTVVSVEGNKLKIWRQGVWHVPDNFL